MAVKIKINKVYTVRGWLGRYDDVLYLPPLLDLHNRPALKPP